MRKISSQFRCIRHHDGVDAHVLQVIVDYRVVGRRFGLGMEVICVKVMLRPGCDKVRVHHLLVNADTPIRSQIRGGSASYELPQSRVHRGLRYSPIPIGLCPLLGVGSVARLVSARACPATPAKRIWFVSCKMSSIPSSHSICSTYVLSLECSH